MLKRTPHRRVRHTQSLAARLQAGPMKTLERLHESLLQLSGSDEATADELGIRLEELTGLVEWAIDDINRAIRTLSPDRMAESRHQPGPDTFMRLRDLCTTFGADSGIDCIFAVDAEHVRFNALMGEVVIRCIGELLSNVEMHAHASEVRVRSSIGEDGSLVLEVRDDGIGLLAGTHPGTNYDGRSFGLWNIDLCLREVGGFIEFDSTEGLTARIVLPGQQVTP